MVSRSGKQIGRFQIQVNICPIDNHGTIGKCETPIRSLDWTEDGKWLLIGEEGLNDGSGQRQDDYYLVNLATMKLSTVASAYTAFWLPGRDQIVYVTPQDLAPLPGGQRKHSVWVQQLNVFRSGQRDAHRHHLRPHEQRGPFLVRRRFRDRWRGAAQIDTAINRV